MIKIEDLDVSFNGVFVLQSLNLQIKNGEYIVIEGHNGAGKSTLMRVLIGEIQHYKGTVSIDGQEVKHKKDWSDIGYVPQHMDHFNQSFPITVEEILHASMITYDKNRLLEIAELLEIKELMKHPFSFLSGGQKQRVMIVRALLQDAKILILDEPTVGIDAKRVTSFHTIMRKIHNQGVTIILVTHHAEEYLGFARIIKLEDGGICV